MIDEALPSATAPTETRPAVEPTVTAEPNVTTTALTTRFFGIAAALSVTWVAICAAYGWARLASIDTALALPPEVLIGVGVGVFGPLMFIWTVAALFDRSADVRRHLMTIAHSAKDSEANIGSVVAVLRAQTEALSATARDVATATRAVAEDGGKVNDALEVLQARGRNASQEIGAIIASSNQAEAVLKQRVAALREVHDQFASSAKNSSQEFNVAMGSALGGVNAFREAAAAALAGAHAAAVALQSAHQRAHDGSQALAARVKALDDVARHVDQHMQEIYSSYGERVKEMSAAADKAVERIRYLMEMLGRSAVDVTRATARSAAEIEAVSESLKQRAAVVSSTSNDLRDTAMRASDQATVAATALGEVVAAVTDSVPGVSAAGGHLREEAERIKETVGASVESVGVLTRQMRSETENVVAAVNQAAERAGTFHQELSVASESFDAAVAASAEKMDQAGAALIKRSGNFGHTARAVAEAMSAAGGAVRAQIDGLDGASRDADARLHDAIEAFGENAKRLRDLGQGASTQVEAACTTFAEQACVLIEAGAEARKQTQALRVARDDADIRAFLSGASSVVERLQATAVDIARLFPSSIEEELWKRYYKGERNIFLNHAAKTLTRRQLNAIKKLYEENPNFRRYASRYVDEYDNLLRLVSDSDRADVLSAVFTHSNMGRLYAVLAKAFGQGGQ